MANNTKTLQDLVNAVVHVLAGQPDSGLSAADIVNGALNTFCSAAEWRWKQKALTLTSVNGQSFINLPADFEQFLVVKRGGVATADCMSQTLDQIVAARQSGSSLTTGTWYCLNWTPQATNTAEPQPIIELYPTPQASTAGYVVGTYLRQIPKLANLTDLPDVPSSYHELLVWWCRAYAVAMETGEFGADWQMVQNLMPAKMALDGKSGGHIGRMRGGLSPSILGPSISGIAGPA